MDGYRVVRMPLSAGRRRGAPGSGRRPRGRADGPRPGRRPWSGGRAVSRAGGLGRRSARLWLTGRATGYPSSTGSGLFPLRPHEWAGWFERGVEPHDLWHGMWAPSLPALAARACPPRRASRCTTHGTSTCAPGSSAGCHAGSGRSSPGFERRWAQRADAVIQVSEPYAEMTARDLGLAAVPIVRNCPDRWDPPVPRPDRIRELLGLPPTTAHRALPGAVRGGPRHRAGDGRHPATSRTRCWC